MKKILIFGIVLAVGAFFVARQAAGKEYRLIVLTDQVSVQHPDDAEFQTVQGTVAVAQGDRVKTSATGRARLRWPNGTLTVLEEDTEIVITELSDGGSKSRIELIVGDMWSKVTRILGVGEYYEVETQETVAAVRGTIFRTTYRNRQARVQTIEHKVRVWTRQVGGAIDESSAVDVDESAQVALDATTPARRLIKRALRADDLRDKVIQRIQRERDLDDNQIGATPEPSPTPTPEPSLSPTPKPTLKPSPTLLPTSSPTPIPSVSLTPIPTPTPRPPVVLESVFPKIIGQGQTFSLEGLNYIEGRNTPRVSAVRVGDDAAVDFSIVGATSIFVTPSNHLPGVYDVGVTTTDGEQLVLKAVLTIQ